MKNPKVTVLMPVYNGEKYLKESIDSILKQTFRDFEFLIIDDGSTDRSIEIISSYNDERIRLIRNEKNMDLVYTLNRGLDMANGEYVARMDQDDISFPERLARQVEYMEANPNVGVCGAWINFFGEAKGRIKYPTESLDIKCHLLFYNALAHPMTMLRKIFFEKYSLRYQRAVAEDYDLWQRCSFLFEMHNIPEVLLHYRISPKSYSKTKSKKTNDVLNDIYKKSLAKLGIEASEDILEIHKKVGNKMRLDSEEQVEKAIDHLRNLHEKNNKLTVYPTKEFDLTLIELGVISCKQSKINKMKKIKLIWSLLNKINNRSFFYNIFSLFKIATKYA